MALAGRSVAVTGATGMQGGAVARALVTAGATVTAVVRKPESEASKRLAEDGVALAVGDLDDASGLRTACEGMDAVFSVQVAASATVDEVQQAANLVRAARDAGVDQFVHSSVSGTRWRSEHRSAESGGTGPYWDAKEAVEDAVTSAGFPAWTIVKPAFFMDNFVEPKVSGMFPLLQQGELLVACPLDTPLAMISSADFGQVVARIVAEPERFSGHTVELASDVRSFAEIAQIYTATTGHPVVATSASRADVDARLAPRTWSGMQIWLESVGYPARPEHAARYGIDLSTEFGDWLTANR